MEQVANVTENFNSTTMMESLGNALNSTISTGATTKDELILLGITVLIIVALIILIWFFFPDAPKEILTDIFLDNQLALSPLLVFYDRRVIENQPQTNNDPATTNLLINNNSRHISGVDPKNALNRLNDYV